MILRNKDNKRIKEIAQSVFSMPLEIWAYGSRVSGEAHEASDLDIVVRTKDLSPCPTDELSDFIDALQESNIPIIIQVFDWTRLPDSFQSNILRAYEVLYKKE